MLFLSLKGSRLTKRRGFLSNDGYLFGNNGGLTVQFLLRLRQYGFLLPSYPERIQTRILRLSRLVFFIRSDLSRLS